MVGRVHSIESFGTVDGPGIRMVIFLSGCPMRCLYCHNPDTWDPKGGTPMTAEDILNQYEQARPFYKKGGITVSGGDPLVQIDFVLELFQKAKARGISTCLDTSAQPFTREEPFISKFEALAQVTDTVLFDLKELDDEKHKALTGWTNRNILDCAHYLSDHGVSMWIRHVLVPGLTDSDEELIATRKFIDELKTVQKVEVLPYHTLGTFKYEKLGIPYTLEGVNPPTNESVQHAKEILGAV